MKNFMNKPLNLIISITCFVISIYFIILILERLIPQTIEEQKMHCLELGSNERALGCWNIIKEKYNLK